VIAAVSTCFESASNSACCCSISLLTPFNFSLTSSVSLTVLASFRMVRYCASSACKLRRRACWSTYCLESYDYEIELYAIGYRVQRVRLEPNHKGSSEFSVDLDADGAEDVYICRLTQRGTLACVDAHRGEEFKRMEVEEEQLFNEVEP
jgi:hypothetical protein